MTAKKSNKIFDLRLLDKLGISIRSLVSDSRKIKPGDTFLAYVGGQYDARDFISQAVDAGANAVLWEERNFSWNPKWQLPSLSIADLKTKSGFIASHVYGNPSKKIRLIGITGTNGKTSCSHWIAQAMMAVNKKTAIIGTLGNGFPDQLEETANTTPDAVLIQHELSKYWSQGASSVAMEVSSHSIAQGRINSSTFSGAVLTNLSRDHMDYHDSMDQYAATKARLFFWPGLKYAILNLDDVFGVELSQQLAGKNIQVFGYRFRQSKAELKLPGYIKIVQGSNVVVSMQGVLFDVEFENYHVQIKAPVIGRFNASNLLAVLATLLASGIRLIDAAKAIQFVHPIVGRMEKLGGGNLPVVIVDYAHTPDALEKVLVTLREILKNSTEQIMPASKKTKLFCVLGCGGSRDRGKRSLIGEVATRLADEVIITSDNPRKESSRRIIDEIAAGAHPGFHIEENRAVAINQAIRRARCGDIVLIAGKGHEAYQEIGNRKIPFSDRNVALQTLHALASERVI